jgi:hypothetical protein
MLNLSQGLRTQLSGRILFYYVQNPRFEPQHWGVGGREGKEKVSAIGIFNNV